MDCGSVCERSDQRTEYSVDDTHDCIFELWRVCHARFELESAVEPSKKPGESIDHFAERGVHIKVEGSFEIEACKLAKMSLLIKYLSACCLVYFYLQLVSKYLLFNIDYLQLVIKYLLFKGGYLQ